MTRSSTEPWRYTENEAPGSVQYYTDLFCTPLQKQRYRAITAVCHSIRAILEIADQEVAQTKLAWWSEEIHRTLNHTPRHPASQALAEVVSDQSLYEEDFHAFINAVFYAFSATTISTSDELTRYRFELERSTVKLTALILGTSMEDAQTWSQSVGKARSLSRVILELGNDVRQGYYLVPESEMTRTGVSLTTLTQAESSAALSMLLSEMAQQAIHQYRLAVDTIPSTAKLYLQADITAATVERERLRATVSSLTNPRFNPLSQRVELTPLRLLWISWRTHLSCKSTTA